MNNKNTEEMFTLEKYPNQLSERLFGLLQRKSFCDTEIIVNNQTFPVHRTILIASSLFFENLSWKKNSSKNDSYSVTLNNVNAEALQWVINFCYTGKIGLKESTVENILDAAGYLEVNELVDICFEYFFKNMKPSNSIKIAELSFLYNKTKIREASFEYSLKHFSEVVNSESFLSINFEFLVTFLKSDEIDIQSEENVFEYLKRWVEYNPVDREIFIPALIDIIRLPLLNKTFLKNDVGKFFKKFDACQDKIEKVIAMNITQDILMSNARKCSIKPLVIGGRNGPTSTLEKFNYCNNSWEKVFDINIIKNVTEFAAVCIGNFIMLLGGYDNGVYQNVITVNIRNGDIESLPPLQTPRSEIRVVELNGLVYAIGGWDQNDQVNTVEIYDIEKKSWSYGTPMRYSRSGFGLAILNNQIYATGGHSMYIHSQSTLEVYSPISKTWTECKPMKNAKNYVELVALGDYLYAFGGCNGPISYSDISYFTDIERYDPKTDSWTTVANFPTGRACVGACSLKNEIIVLGGKNENSILTDVYIFDPKDNSLKKQQELKSARQNPRVVSYIRI